MLKEGRFRSDIGKKYFTTRLVKPMAESSWCPEETGSAHVAPHFSCTDQQLPCGAAAPAQEGAWDQWEA